MKGVQIDPLSQKKLPSKSPALLGLNVKKATTHKNIPPKVLKTNAILLPKHCNNFSNKGKFCPSNLENAYVAPVFKKKYPLNKENYRPFNVLSITSMVFDKFTHKIFFVAIPVWLQKWL